jgi:MATE family multidrug resistance protein
VTRPPAVPLRSELRRLVALAVPVALSQLAVMLMGIVDYFLVGQLGAGALAALGLGNTWIFGTILFFSGIVLGIDPIVSQAHGARDGTRAALAFQRGSVLGLVFSVPVMWLWAETERALLLFGQDPALARLAGVYVDMQIVSVPFFLCQIALRQYLQGREIVRPALVVVLVANVANGVLAWMLIYGHFGLPALGVAGAGIATAVTRSLAFLLLAWITLRFALHRGAWVPWSRQALAWPGLREVMGLGFPIALQTSLEMWAFQLSNFVAGRLGTVELAAHLLVMQLASISFMVIVGIAQATSVRVGNLLGAGERQRAQRAGWLGIALGAGFMALAAVSFVLGRHWLPDLYTDDAAVLAAAAAILPIAGAFEIFDGTQGVACGVLRGMGRPGPAAVANLLGYWLLALPLGAHLALRGDGGLEGLWWGLCAGLVAVASGLLVWIRFRGPARAKALVASG